MNIFKYIYKKIFLVTFTLTLITTSNSLATEEKVQDIADQIAIIAKDLKTLDLIKQL